MPGIGATCIGPPWWPGGKCCISTMPPGTGPIMCGGIGCMCGGMGPIIPTGAPGCCMYWPMAVPPPTGTGPIGTGEPGCSCGITWWWRTRGGCPGAICITEPIGCCTICIPGCGIGGPIGGPACIMGCGGSPSCGIACRRYCCGTCGGSALGCIGGPGIGCGGIGCSCPWVGMEAMIVCAGATCVLVPSGPTVVMPGMPGPTITTGGGT
mmetsp:Transcript_41677/g.107890  ORF Transcript_41677/g.107890 Transcript_41677/m.107890 type:complete len:209 (+) Transcript_41677:576-1202(+)